MKIVELRAKNVKRLRAVEIRPDGALQVIGGRNAQGKSSVLDAIWLALGGGKASKETHLPIREGEKSASVRLDLGDIVVTRSWTQKGTQLKVTAADGAAYPSPQAMLDRLVGAMSFDPLAFTRLPAGKQRETLLELVKLDVDLDALAVKRREVYERRAEVGREGKALGEVAVDESLPVEVESVSDLLDEYERAQKTNELRKACEDSVAAHLDDIRELRKTIVTLQMSIDKAEDDIRVAEAALSDTKVELEELPDVQDLAEIGRRLAGVEGRNARIRENNEARKRLERKNALRLKYEDLTSEIADLDRVKTEALAAANFPVDGLGFDEDGVTYNGIPFAQASSAEQIRVSLAMAMALNPELKVLRIKDGSLLDGDTMEAIREQIVERDFQLWIERVGDADAGAVIIEDGEVAS